MAGVWLLWLQELLWLVMFIYRRGVKSGAIPASEYVPAAVIHRFEGALWALIAGLAVLAPLCLVISGWWFRRSGASRATCVVPILAGVAGGVAGAMDRPLIAGLVAVVCGIGVLAVADQYTPGPAGRATALRAAVILRRARWRDALDVVCQLVAATVIAGLLVMLAEATLYTGRFSRELSPWPLLGRHLALAATIGLTAGLYWGALLAGLLAGAMIALVAAARRRYAPFRLLPLLAGIGAGVTVHLAIAKLLFAAMSGEIEALELAGIATGLTGAIGAGVGLLVRQNLRFWVGPGLEARPDARLPELVRCLVLSGSPAPMSAVGRLARALTRRPRAIERFGTAAALAGAGLACWVMCQINYPSLADYGTTGQNIYSLGLVAMVVVGVFVLVQPRLAGTAIPRYATILAVAAAAIAAAPLSRRLCRSHATRQVLREYSVIASIHFEGLLWTDPEQWYVGTQPPAGDDGRFAFHGQAEDRLPEVPELPVPTGLPPIFLIILDAGRPDRMHMYGYERQTTPNLDRLARDSVVFESAYSQASSTSASMRALFTGRHCTRYMLATDTVPAFVTDQLAEIGYRTFALSVSETDFNGIPMAAFLQTLSPQLRRECDFVPIPVDVTFRPKEEMNEQEMVEKLLGYVRQDAANEASGGRQAGLFSWLHLTTTHFPWINVPWGPRYGTSMEDRYDECMRECDRIVGVGLDKLRKMGIYDEAVIVVTADHGTGLNEHGRYAGFLTYEEQIRVPLIVKIPGVKPRRVTERVGLFDLAPTWINLFRRGVPNEFHGVSLLELMMGRRETLDRRYLFSLCAFEDAVSVNDAGQWKFHHHRYRDYVALYDLARDPGELVNVADREKDRVEAYTKLVERFLWAGCDSYGNPYHYKTWRSPCR